VQAPAAVDKAPPAAFTGYQKFVVAVLAFLQFTIILDFMILSPLGAMLMPALEITPKQFGLVVSAYAFSAGASGLLASGFADRFDRKRLLLFFYAGFVLGTLLCGIATTYEFLLAARMITGVFGGVIGSIVFAITTDLFPLSMRGRVMGFIQTAFAASQVLGIPFGLFLSSRWGWHAPFLLIVGVSAAVGLVIMRYLRPIDEHLALRDARSGSPFDHLVATVSNRFYVQAFATTALLATGGFMLMPFGSAFTVHNLGIDLDDLPMVYMISGVCSIFIGPLVGKLTDAIGKLPMFLAGSLLTIVLVLIYTNLGVTPLPLVILVNVVMFVGITGRMISSQALMSAIPAPASRGSFMSVGASIQQVSGGFAAALAGMIVEARSDGSLLHFDRLGYVVVAATVVTMTMMTLINKMIVSGQAPGTQAMAAMKATADAAAEAPHEPLQAAAGDGH
jgi:predicted MFS family arabinose efflux permease